MTLGFSVLHWERGPYQVCSKYDPSRRPTLQVTKRLNSIRNEFNGKNLE